MTPDQLTQLVQNPFKTRLKGVLLLHLNHTLSIEMTLLVGMLVFINQLSWDCNGKICHLYENVQNRLQNKFDGVRKLASNFSGKIQNGRHEITNVIIYSSRIEKEIISPYQRMQCNK